MHWGTIPNPRSYSYAHPNLLTITQRGGGQNDSDSTPAESESFLLRIIFTGVESESFSGGEEAARSQEMILF